MDAIINSNINNKIYTIRGIQVMLDRDLATFYNIKAIRLREQIKRNIDRFPDDFFNLVKKKLIPWYRKMRYLQKNT